MIREQENNIQNTPLLVLAGGYGRRLRDVVNNVPKPLAPIGEVPFLAFLIKSWKSQGCKKFIFLLHYQANQIVEWLDQVRDTCLAECTYSVVVENSPLGTGGAIANAVKVNSLSGNFLVANADTWLSGGLREVLQSNKLPSIGVVNVPSVDRFGEVHFNESGRVTAFSEKNKSLNRGWVNAGIYYFSANDFLEWDGGDFSIELDWFPAQVRHKRLFISKLMVDFIDIGVPKDYEKFCSDYVRLSK